MNAFYEHHRDSIRFGYRCFDRILLNGLIQPFQNDDYLIRSCAPEVGIDKFVATASRRLNDRSVPVPLVGLLFHPQLKLFSPPRSGGLNYPDTNCNHADGRDATVIELAAAFLARTAARGGSPSSPAGAAAHGW
jgi:hypothetical protein